MIYLLFNFSGDKIVYAFNYQAVWTGAMLLRGFHPPKCWSGKNASSTKELRMELAVHGKQMDVGDALRGHVAAKLGDINAKYFNRAIDTTVTFAPESHSLVRTHISLRVGKDLQVSASAIEGDAYASFDSAATKVAKQLGRYKQRLRDHHERVGQQTPESEMTKARDYVLATKALDGIPSDVEEEEIPVGTDPVIVAEEPMHIQKMSIADAVMRLDLGGDHALLFRNPNNNGLNMVYRRADGNIGWVEPVDDEAAKTAAKK
jgi:ribosomal subunit interface protein